MMVLPCQQKITMGTLQLRYIHKFALLCIVIVMVTKDDQPQEDTISVNKPNLSDNVS